MWRERRRMALNLIVRIEKVQTKHNNQIKSDNPLCGLRLIQGVMCS